MSPQARVAKLEGLLSRIQQNRRPSPYSSAHVEDASEAMKTPEMVRARDAAPPAAKMPSVQPPMPTHAVVSPLPTPPSEPPMAEPTRTPRPTPMEQAVVVELETMDRPTDSAVDVEITFDDEGNEITVEAGEEAAVSFEDTSPTAPVETRAEAPIEARPIALEPAAPSAPVARAVSRHPRSEPATFGELLDRTLALRPR